VIEKNHPGADASKHIEGMIACGRRGRGRRQRVRNNTAKSSAARIPASARSERSPFFQETKAGHDFRVVAGILPDIRYLTVL
jgi:hypothetical protein